MKSGTSQGQAGALAGMASWEKGVAQIRINNFHWGTAGFQIAAVEPVTMSIAPGKFETITCA